MSILLDTNVLSELLRAGPDAAVTAWMSRQPAEGLFVSSVTQAEMLLGVRLLPAGRRRTALELALHEMFRDDFASRVLPFDSAAAVHYADIVERRRGLGRPISQFDAQIAAIARAHRAAVATRNVADFQDCGVVVLDPWSAGA